MLLITPLCQLVVAFSRKIQPVLDTLSHTFLRCYNPGQELSVDEGMVKYKGRASGKVVR